MDTYLPSKKLIGCKWGYKIKYRFNGTIEHYKARLVAKVFTQIERSWLPKNFAPTVKLVIVLLPSWCYSTQLDLVSIGCEQYLPTWKSRPDFPNRRNIVCRLNKFVYGLKQVSAISLLNSLHTFLMPVSHNQKLIFLCSYPVKDFFTAVLIYVDYIIITGN